MTCLGSGTWSAANVSCEKACVNVEGPVGGKGNVTCDSYPVWHGGVCRYSCGNDAFSALATRNMLTGNLDLISAPGPGNFISRMCQADGSFNGTLPICISVCQPLLPSINGKLALLGSISTFFCSFFCQKLFCPGTFGIKKLTWSFKTYRCCLYGKFVDMLNEFPKSKI